MPTDPAPFLDVRRIIAETFVRSVDCHEELASTNDRALQLANAQNVQLPCLVIARRQTRGRGRGSHRWWSDEGALTFSLLLELTDRLPTARWPEMSLTVGSSICIAIARRLPGEDVRLKWPNDVYVRGAKAGGVLVEVPHTRSRQESEVGGRTSGVRRQGAGGRRQGAGVRGQGAGGGDECESVRVGEAGSEATPSPSYPHTPSLSHSQTLTPNKSPLHVIIGIGLNVNNSIRSAPAELSGRAISLCDVGGPQPFEDVLVEVLRSFAEQLEGLTRDPESVRRQWRAFDLLLGSRVRLEDGRESTTGVCVGIDADGALLLETQSGPRRCYAGVVQAID